MTPHILRREPALIAGAMSALLALAGSFGFKLSGEQTSALVAVASAVLALAVRRTVYTASTVATEVTATAAEVGTEVARQLGEVTAGRPGEVTSAAQSVVSDVVNDAVTRMTSVK